MHFYGTITGTLTKAELKFSQAGKPFWRGRVAVNHKRKNQQGTYEDSGTTWLTVTAFGHMAENASNAVPEKGLVTATGRIETRAWKKDDGSEGSSLEMVADALGPAVAPWPDKNQQPAQSQGGGWGQPQSQPQSDPWAGTQTTQGGWDAPSSGPAF